PAQICCGVGGKNACVDDAAICDQIIFAVGCDEASDCKSGEVCCYIQNKGGDGTYCARSEDCVNGSSLPANGGYLTQVCQADCDCVSGRCSDAATVGLGGQAKAFKCE